MPFSDIFNKRADGSLVVLNTFQIHNHWIHTGEIIGKGDHIHGFNPALLEYLDWVLKDAGKNRYKLVGFLPKK